MEREAAAAQWYQQAIAAYRQAVTQQAAINRADRAALALAIDRTDDAGREVSHALAALCGATAEHRKFFAKRHRG